MSSPIVKTMRVVPVAGRDGMLLNLSGALSLIHISEPTRPY